MKNKNLPYWLFILSVFSALLIPTLVQDGMFLDGLVNSSIARNLAKGEGGLWVLQYSKTFSNPFYDQLPLAIGLQSLFFKLFGDHLFVERIYSILTAIITGIFIIKIWKHIFRDNNELVALSWLPFLFWIITPVVFWSYSNNMLENTMAIFDIAAIYLIIKALDTNKNIFIRLVITGTLIFAAFFSKGPVGIFPLATVFIYWLCFKNLSFFKAMKYSAIVFFVPVLLLSLLFLFEPDALHSISKFLSQQVANSIEGKRELASSRYYIAGRLLSELIPVMILLLVLFVINQIKQVKIATNLNNKKLLFFFLAVALSGSLPILISLKQAGYYLVPSFPFYALAAGIIAAPRLNVLMQKIKSESRSFRIVTIITMILFCGTLIFSFMQTGKIGRDKETVKDIYIIGKIVPRNSIISICPNLTYDWGLHAYMMRYFNNSMDEKNQHEFYITEKDCENEINKDYMKIETNTSIYEIYKRK